MRLFWTSSPSAPLDKITHTKQDKFITVRTKSLWWVCVCVCHCFTAFHFMVLKLAAGLYKVTHPICSILHTFCHFKIPIFLNVTMVIIIMFTAPYMLQLPRSVCICMQHGNGSIFSKCWVGVLIVISSVLSPKYMPPFSRHRHEITLYADGVIAISIEGKKIKVFLLG